MIILKVLLIFFVSNFTLTEEPPGNITDLNICKVSHLGLEYTGHIAKSESKVRCQSWTSEVPHKIREDLLDSQFSDVSKKKAKNYCRNPTKDNAGPWCYTMNYDLQFETCGIPLCQYSQCKVTGPGMEYAGEHKKGVSGRNCLKWNKDRKKVKENGKYVSIPKFSKQFFPEENLGDAKKFCRNPDGDIGGPWCFIENENTDEIEREYCDIPFCDDPECLVFAKNSHSYMHYTDFNESLTNLSFGVKLWDSDTYLGASARLVLSVLALPLTGKEIDDSGVGIEILIGNNFSTLRYGNKDQPEYEPTYGILKSTEFTKFSLSWHAGFITFGLEGHVKPIFLAEYKTKSNLLGFKKNMFYYYSVQGNNLLWHFPFCKDNSGCDVHTTTGKEFQQFWFLREQAASYDLYTHVRAFHSARILFVSSPTKDYPQVKVTFSGKNNYTTITSVAYSGASEVILKKLFLGSILDYWKWRQFSISFFADNMNIYIKKSLGLQVITELSDEIFRKMRWFSVSSENTVAHWSFFCTPPKIFDPPPAFLPECALNSQESNYKGTQDITSEGLPCLPWSASNLLGKEVKFSNDSTLKAWNYCRDPSGTNKGTYCYALSLVPEKKIEEKPCRLRKCKSEQCRMAGTGNDFIGSLSTTRSNRTCAPWVIDTFSMNAVNTKIWNDTLFPDMTAIKAKNFCRNPSRNISGSWCYTTDSDVPEDACNVRDCDRPEECTVVVASILLDRKTYILPQWKETGLRGGLRFAIKEWNPDLLDGISILISSKTGLDNILLQIAAEYNEKVLLFYNSKLIQEKTLPHLIAAGKWTDFWLQIRRGELMLGLEGVPTSLFEWKSADKDKDFDPMYLNYASIFGKPMGLFFKCDECHTENISVYNFERYYPIGLWLDERSIFRHFSLQLRGVGITAVRLMVLPESPNFYLFNLDINNGTIYFSKVLDDSRLYHLETVKLESVMTTTSWTKYDIYLNQFEFKVKKNNITVLTHKSQKPLIMYWFSIAAQKGWVIWSANCEPLDLDGPPRDGGWSAWSPWTCTVSCGGGEGYRTRTCSNPRPNIFGKLCQGSPTTSGKCNDFPCGDVSPETLEKIRGYLQKENFGYVIEEGQKREGSRGITTVFRSMWKVTKGKKIEVAMKMLKQEYSDRYLKDFLTLAGQWAFLESSAIVRLFGIAFTSNISLVLEYFRLGPLDDYLRKNKGILKPVDLIEATCNLASALWHLTEKEIVHGNIRCRKVMVNSHDENSFTVKLTDPGIHVEYASSEVHWIPIECYSNLDYAKRSSEADVWSFATTLWEIFMYGEEIKPTDFSDHVQAMRWYVSGKRLPQPRSCSNEIYSLMKECWDIDPHKRKKPQAIMRDVNQILYEIYNSRRIHSYAKVFTKSIDTQNIASTSANSSCSNITESTTAAYSDDLVEARDVDNEFSDESSISLIRSQNWLMDSQELEDSNAYDWSNLMSNFNISTATTSLDSLNSMQSVFELDGNYNVVLQGRIGQGFYGEVFKGTLECVDGDSEDLRKVAVKKLKSSALSSCLQDFEREINIMKSLKHPNIVEILGVLREPEISLVMEFVHHGSLQSYLKIYRELLQEAQLLKYALDIAKGMDYLGKKNIVHRDLASRNILVVDENHVKISDFGLAQVMGTNDYYILKTPNRELPIKWYAPESLRDGKFSVRSDVWSYGVTMCEMFNYGEEPNLTYIDEKMEGQQQQILLTALERGARFPCPPNCPKAVYIRIIYPCWQADPHERPLFSKLTLEIEDLLIQY
ncbi:tyrosine-protein kinase hopscotch isoform X2 [Leptinotarsa decemlineata]|uniref:tyrosine-protein kinase hopscotch isoform X2 n=1 Tax=Leptinotarsa decemlineata TaxID=7539 RepID=UPI003D30C900